MGKLAIEARGLGKEYRIGRRQEKYGMLRERLTSGARGLARRISSAEARRKAAEVRDPRFWALRDVDFDVRQGEVVGVIGRNGAGKSTLLKVLSGITTPSSGSVAVRGRLSALLEVGTGFHPELTGRENIYLNGAILGFKRQEIQRRFDEIVDFSEVEKFIDTAVKHYSSGMYLRLAFAVAAHMEPDVLVVDEVLAVGDTHFQKRCLGKIHGEADKGRTVLFVSHNMAAVRSLCETTLVMDSGQVAFRGSVKEGIEYYTSLGSSRMAADDLTGVQRSGLGGIRLKQMRILSGGAEVPAHICGEPVELAFQYEIAGDLDVYDLRFRAHFLDDVGSTIFTLCSKTVEAGVAEKRRFPQSGWFVFSLDRLPLRPGMYPLTISVESARGMEDVLDHAVNFEIHEGDFYGTGNMLPRNMGTVLVPHAFHVEPG
jgi:lipopolysaccharide transport system ATP-binding protein